MPNYEIRLRPAAKRALEQTLSEKVAAAVIEFISGPLAENPYRVGRQLSAPHFPAFAARKGTFRIIYLVDEIQRLVEILRIAHRANVYRP